MVWPGGITEPLAQLRERIDQADRAYREGPVWTPDPVCCGKLLTHEYCEPIDCGFIYVFEITGGEPSDVLKAMRDAKQRHNLPEIGARAVPSRVLYVGSSGKGLQVRLRQHVRPTPAATYALKIKTWLDDVPGFAARVHVKGYANLETHTRLMIEDAVASLARPMVGKRGGSPST